MTKQKINQLNYLFEKMLSNTANKDEQYQLQHLYAEYIDDGRTKVKPATQQINTN